MEIWDILLKKFTGLYFASSVAIGDGTGGGDDGGDSGGGGDEGGTTDDAGGLEDAGDEGGTDDETDTDAEGTEGDSEAGEDEEGSEGARGAKRPLTPEQQSKAVEKALNKLKESDPEGAKLLRKEFFKTRQQADQYRESFATPQEARQAQELVESIGGQAGFARAQKELTAYATELDQMAKGDPRAIEDLAGDFPKGFAKLVPHALDKLRGIDSAGYERLVSRHMASTMAEKGFSRSVERLAELIGDGKQEQALALANAALKWIRDTEQFGKAQPQDANKEEMSEVERARQEVETEKSNLFTQRVSSEVTQTMNGIISKHLNPIIKGKVLSLAQKQSLASGIFSRIAGTLQKDRTYQERLKSLLAERDDNGVKRYVGSQVSRLAKRAVDAEWAARGFTSSGKKRTANGSGNGASGGSGPALVGRKPDASKIDWDKDRSKMRYMQGEATLKKEFGGRVVRWDRNAL
jgi:hypothetical protein